MNILLTILAMFVAVAIYVVLVTMGAHVIGGWLDRRFGKKPMKRPYPWERYR